ncbi:MAG: glucose-1-phosphate thymidylyltransferase RfbA [Bacteroidia bacterium]|nr:glucose-1-phosphate thymidylyltransferase RfbA [Bacteroidia bacterium]
MKGIILAGGSGTRLYPITQVISKQLMPVYDKPMIYYPLSTLLSAGIQDILIITAPDDQQLFTKLLGDGSQLGCSFSYAIQANPNGIAEAFLIAADFIADEKVALILGDNIFYGTGLNALLTRCTDPNGGIIFGYHVQDPQRYGVIEFNENFEAMSIEEKPKSPKSNYAIPGIYFYDNEVIDIARGITPSSRGELEISDINRKYLSLGKLQVRRLDRGMAWLDTGTVNSLMQAAQFVEVIEERQGLKIGCIEEIAFTKGFISKEQLASLAQPLIKSGYGKYLMDLIA